MLPGVEDCSSAIEYAFERQMGFHDRGLQHDKTEVFVDSDIHLDETFHQRLIFADSRCDKLHQVVISARNQMTFDDRIYFLDSHGTAREIGLAMIFERNLGELRRNLSELGDVDLGGIAGDDAIRLEPLE